MNKLHSIFNKEDGMIIFVSNEHPLKALFPITRIEEGIVISVNDKHPLIRELG